MALHLVTGGAGFIGSHILEELLRDGENVRILDNFSTGKRENIKMAEESAGSSKGVEVIEGDIRNMDTVRKTMKSVDYVFHVAALPSVQRSLRDPITTDEVNVRGTLNLLVAAKDEKVKRLVFASSSSVYGNSEKLPKEETMQTLPISPYAVSKLAGEKYCMAFYSVYGLPTVALRFFNVFGPRQDADSEYSGVIAKFARAIIGGSPVTIFGDGLQTRDFTFVRNVVHGSLLAVTCPTAIGKVINVACGERWTILQLVETLEKSLGIEVAHSHVEQRTGDVRDSQADIQNARLWLNYQPRVRFEAGIAATASWYSSVLRGK
jgi:nucleoside-diphosphate-sugar epimerase